MTAEEGLPTALGEFQGDEIPFPLGKGLHMTVATCKRPQALFSLPSCCSMGAKWCIRDQLLQPHQKETCRAIKRACPCRVIDFGRVEEVADGFM